MLREREKDKERKRERAFVPGFRRVYFYFSNFEESLRNINTSVTEFNRVSPATSILYERNYLVDWYFPELNGLISMKRVQSMGLLDFSYIILLLCVVSMIQSTWHGCYWYNQSIDGGTEFHRILRSRCLLRGPMSSFYHLSSFSVSPILCESINQRVQYDQQSIPSISWELTMFYRDFSESTCPLVRCDWPMALNSHFLRFVVAQSTCHRYHQ